MGLGRLGVILLHCCILSVVSTYAVELPSAKDIMRRVESNQRIESEAVVFEMILTDKTGSTRRREVREFRRREDGGLESSLIFFDAPPDIRGSALLSKERPDGRDDQWLYLPAVGKIRRIADSGRTDYFLGTDLTFEDFSVEDIDRFSYRYASPDTAIDGRSCHVIDATPADTASARRSAYGVRRVYVDMDRYLILKTDYFDRAGKLIKVMQASKVNRYEEAWRSDLVFVDNFRRTHQTRINIIRREIHENYPPDFFTPRTLQRGALPEIFPRPTQTIPKTP